MKKDIEWSGSSWCRWKYKISMGEVMFCEKGKNDWRSAEGVTFQAVLFDLVAAVEARKLKNYIE